MNRRDSKINFKAEFPKINDINAWVYNGVGDHIIACGTSSLNKVGFFKIRNTGDYAYFYTISTTNDAICKGIEFESSSQIISILFTTKNDLVFNPLRSSYLGSTLNTNYFIQDDAVLVQFRETGILVRAKEIAFSATGVQMPNQNLFRFNNYFVFGGYSDQYDTQMRAANVFPNTRTDVFLMKYLLDIDGKQKCLYEEEINYSQANSAFTLVE